MKPHPPIPVALRVVATLFLLSGINSLLSMIVDALHRNFTLDFGFIGIFIYFGLMRFSPGWRNCALVLTWLGAFFSPIGAIIIMFTLFHSDIPQSNIHIASSLNISGIHFFNISPVIIFIITGIYFALCLWILSVLNRADIRLLFKQQEVIQSLSPETN